ncbi:MAG: hypothetical protein JF571_12150, partial [Asticcacaulis sp.]|nr:hypothetical protein [Asticcacaulis sp.]
MKRLQETPRNSREAARSRQVANALLQALKPLGTLVLATVLCLLAATTPAAADEQRLSQGWLFSKGEVKGGETPTLDERGWKSVTVPHDWSIMDQRDGAGPFDRRATAGQ